MLSKNPARATHSPIGDHSDSGLISTPAQPFNDVFTSSMPPGGPRTAQPASHDDASDSPPTGQIGKYRLVRRTGVVDGIATTYLAEHPDGSRVSLKILSSRLLPSQIEQIKADLMAATSWKHNHIASIFEVGQADGYDYVATQWIDGISLAQVTVVDKRNVPAAGQPLSSIADGIRSHWSKISAFGSQVADALHYVHEAGMVHRDIQISNLWIDDDNHAWLADIGLRPFDKNRMVGTTQSNETTSTLKYTAPEQLLGRSDHRSDIYSLGLVLYELLMAGSPRKPITIGKSSKLPHLLELRPEIPKDLARIVMKCCRIDPTRRYQSAEQLSRDLRGWQKGKKPKRPQTVVGSKTSRRDWMCWLPMACIIVACAIGLWLSHHA